MYRFHDSQIDTNLFSQLEDLATVLTKVEDLNFEYSYGSFFDLAANKVTASTTWDTTKPDIKKAGLKTDIYLRAIGTFYYSDIHALKAFLNETQESRLPKFASQLAALLEDMRLEEKIKKDRPGTSLEFHIRNSYLRDYFTKQLSANVTKGLALDELFCLIYLTLQADSPNPSFPKANPKQLESLEMIKPLLYSVFEAAYTIDITTITAQIVFQFDTVFTDMQNVYYVFPMKQIEQYRAQTLFDELTRTDELENEDTEAFDTDQSEYFDEEFSTWHQENKNEDRKQNFLQMDLEQGTKTSMLGGEARETEDGDQAVASVQGTSAESKNRDFSDTETLDKKENRRESGANNPPYGEANKDAVIQIKTAEEPSAEEKTLYQQYAETIEIFTKKLAKTIEKSLEHKKNQPRSNLHMGRLSKNLLPIITDDNPRLFYKKNNESKELDATFTLLVDCSASMHGKMEETKKGIVLFHEVLTALKIPHSIIGFWEDAMEADQHYQPNYFHIIHSEKDSFYKNNGPKIMQLKPEEDNRDGFSIRVITEQLEARSEKHKFMLVFSDGQPAAYNYAQDGILDTNEAVTEARRKGIEVVGMFLSDGEVTESEDALMKNIYGKERVLIPDVSELAEQFAPLLKRLLLKTI